MCLMNSLITDDYQRLNAESHTAHSNWGRGGLLWKDFIAGLLRDFNAKTVIDYGCGKGGMTDALAALGYDVQGYDPAIPAFHKLPRKADFLVSLDVLEHIEPECLDAVLAHICGLAPVCFLTIATRNAKHVLPDGRNAHLIVQNSAWWTERLGQYFSQIIPQPIFRNREMAVLCNAGKA